jgi:quinol monooxygenase YgiN
MIGPVSASPASPAPGLLRAAAAGHDAAAPAGSAPASSLVADDVAVLLLADVAAASRLWGWSRIVLGAWPLRRVPGLRLAKALGSGHEGGFGLRPSASRQGLFALFGSEVDADAFVQTSPIPRAYAERSCEFMCLKLRATSSRGAWGGATMTATAKAPNCGPVAALTRASIRPSRARAFWAHSPASERALQDAPGCLLAVGLGEAPILRQATFSLWESQSAMDAYARSGPHLQAIRAAGAGGWFSESMFVRFVPLEVRGCWRGRRYG